MFYIRNGSSKLNICCICLLFLKYRKLSRIFLENLKNTILTIFVPLSIIENICFYPTLINLILFHQMAYQLIWDANKALVLPSMRCNSIQGKCLCLNCVYWSAFGYTIYKYIFFPSGTYTNTCDVWAGHIQLSMCEAWIFQI